MFPFLSTSKRKKFFCMSHCMATCAHCCCTFSVHLNLALSFLEDPLSFLPLPFRQWKMLLNRLSLLSFCQTKPSSQLPSYVLWSSSNHPGDPPLDSLQFINNTLIAGCPKSGHGAPDVLS